MAVEQFLRGEKVKRNNLNDNNLGVEHVKEVELGVDGDGGLLPSSVRGRPFLYHHLLCKKLAVQKSNGYQIVCKKTKYRVDDLVEELMGEGQ